MRRFNITVDGKAYQVDVEEIGGAPAAPVTAVPLPAPAPAPVAAAKPAPAPAPAAPKAAIPDGGVKLNAPLPGTVVGLKAANGATVKKGQTVLVIEAMKMENDIASPADGVLTFAVAQGENVQQNQLLAVIK
ncbi:MAG: acetyl-CoA carboxylase biotin carboxyl carrier protein subunit [Clostridiales bacterium]|jgi:glutaconyl-CoA decarboxylase|nr:acetyl-CoA carboxylase biotin carboxyl carrier protein subunit [Clostridiales bacterium]